ncbi:hypothetical protein KWG64_15895 [Rahnella sp. PD12R]|uniref:hypothetical protein n=1 Tax=Rahnella sp. PD12R TaxID=2855688 RepID=UPI001C444112|nr:hypothetical protein [Rahnella sp. PD12R]MBV6819423.1 hypothetical protein [Rahnella sp. PD12R]
MQDLFFEEIAVQRMALFSRLVAVGDCDQEEKTLALGWLAELNAELLKNLRQGEKKNPQSGGSDSGLLQ